MISERRGVVEAARSLEAQRSGGHRHPRAAEDGESMAMQRRKRWLFALHEPLQQSRHASDVSLNSGSSIAM